MNIELVKVHFDGGFSYKYLPVQYCCKKLQLNPAIVIDCQSESLSCYCENCKDRPFNYELDSECEKCELMKETLKEDTFTPALFIRSVNMIYDMEDAWEQEDFHRVDYCPHCGEKVTVTVVKEIDASERYQALLKREKALNTRRRKTDSKKKESQILAELTTIRKQIDGFYGVGEYHEENFFPDIEKSQISHLAGTQ